MPKVYGGQAFRKSLFPSTKYIESLIKAYAPDLKPGAFSAEAFLSAFRDARDTKFDAAFAEITSDGASCGMQLCWCLLDIPAGTTLPLHAHKNLEVVYTLRGCMRERHIDQDLPLERIKAQVEIDWFDCADAEVVECCYPAGSMALYSPGSVHQIYTDKAEGCLLLVLYSKDCTFIRATNPALARQLLPAKADKDMTYHMTPWVQNAPTRSFASFCSSDPRYAKYRSSGLLGTASKPATATVAQVAVKALADCGVRDVILYPGAKCIELLKVVDSNAYGVRGWLCRNEHAGAFIGEAYNKSQGDRLCAVMTTSGPGATNLCTGIASAWRDAVPMVVVTSQVPTYKAGTAAFQEVPVVELYKPITKGTFAVTCASQVYDMVVSACRLAVHGVNGPVVVDIPEDLQAEHVTLPRCTHSTHSMVPPPPPVDARLALSGRSTTAPTAPLQSPDQAGWLAHQAVGLRSHVECAIRNSVMREVLGYIREAKRPLLLLGGGCVRVDEALLNELVDMLGMPVVYTFMGKGCISDDHELCLGPIGVHGLYTANTAAKGCDLLLALGCRFDERAACKAFDWQDKKTVVHVDLAPQRSMSGAPKNVVTCSIVADVGDFVGVLLQHLYGFMEERSRTLSTALPGMFSGGSHLATLDELRAFVVDDDDLQVLRDTYTKDSGDKAAGEPKQTMDKAGPAAAAAAAAAGTDLYNESPFIKEAQNGNNAALATGQDAPAAAAGGAVIGLAGCESDWQLYEDWSRELSEMKSRRWRSCLPCLAAKDELTTREMVHLLDVFLSHRGLEPIVCSDVGSHQCLLTQYLRLHHPRQWLMQGGLASMGCGLPAAIGAALANPQATCLAVAGDGGFAMTSQELMMAKVYKLNVKVIVTVNNRLQLVEQLEEETFDSLDVFTFIGDPDHPHRPYPNFAKVAEAYGVPSVTAWNKQELLDGLSLMFSTRGPFLLEVIALAERPHIKYWDSSEQ